MPAFLFLNPLNWSFLYCEPIVTFKIVAVSFPLVSDTFAFAPATKYLCFKEKKIPDLSFDEVFKLLCFRS